MNELSLEFKNHNNVNTLYDKTTKYIEDNKLSYQAINSLFYDLILHNEYPLLFYTLMADYGVDMHYANDIIFYASIYYDNSNILLYFINELGFDINKENGLILSYVHNNNILKILLDNGLIINRDNLERINLDVDTLKFLINYGVDINELMHSTTINCNKFDWDNESTLDDDLVNEFINQLTINNNYDINILNDFFIAVYGDYELSIQQMKEFIDLGANPRSHIDTMFEQASYYGNKDHILYLINNYNVDINVRNSIALKNAILENNFDIAKMLIDLNINITDEIIVASCVDVRYIDLFIDKGITVEKIAKLFFSNLYITNFKNIFIDINKFGVNYKITYVKRLRDYGIDLNEILDGI